MADNLLYSLTGFMLGLGTSALYYLNGLIRPLRRP